MKGNKSRPRNYEAIACYLMRRLERTQKRADEAKARAEIAEAERDQLRAQMQSLHEQMKRIQGGLDKAAVSILETLYKA